MARAPVAGEAKTRLIPSLGAAGAARLQALLARRAAATAAEAALGPVTLACAPDCGHPFFQRCATELGVELAQQHGNDLGQRMAELFRRCLPASPVILTGSDCPALRPRDLQQAWDALQFHDAVITPAQDGGYVLIGLRRFAPVLFEGVAWGSGAVMAQTRERLVRLGWRWDELPVQWDVDRPEDLTRLRRSGLLDLGDVDAAGGPEAKRNATARG